MNPDTLLAHFDRLCEAPGAIPRLRRFILDLAVRGKLVEQDPNDEPASELLKRIQAEIARLVKNGEMRREKPYPRVEADEVAFNAPSAWEWVRIRQVTSDRGQTTPKHDFTYIDVTAIDKELGYIRNATVISASDAPSRARKLVQKDDVLYSCVRPYLLNVAIVDRDIVPHPIASTAFAVLNGFGLVLPKYLWTALRSPFMVESVELRMRGQAYPAINDSDFAVLPFPLPPLAEQRRIVAKVDELMALCDRLEAAQAERERRRDRLAAAALQRLNQPAADTATIQKHSIFHLSNLAHITTSPAHIARLRLMIQNLALQGKLIPQDASDESASHLLSRISKQRQAGMPRKPSNDPLPVGEVPHSVPTSWAWCRVEQVATVCLGGTPSRGESSYWAGPVPWVSSGEVANNRIRDTREKISDAGLSNSNAKIYPRNSVLIAMIGEGKTRGQSAILEIEACTNQNVAGLIFDAGNVEPEYIWLWALREYARTRSEGRGGGQPALNCAIVRSLCIPLPPLGEQRRIVERVKELIGTCDRLESRLVTAQTARQRLLDVLLR